ncbi:hypothetical protein SmJEL517_g04333 [Synchytrium microbalum]|uniref:TATA element modulatory factor 1 TATA binding domain-containing protein n=1 Tax=Synchytrium microbalum TaxID=1806994 RepID=A0A507C5C8_9FUNG|nr:uncharacterized protein SmJEL517_g04333 [Synchytrium microbalum]TPX32645.1 hypothetical protein SmJEL517_g04333 [Synchytrium microbalum]
MSFWDSIGSLDGKLNDLVGSALKTVESRIDKVLDIGSNNGEAASNSRGASQPIATSSEDFFQNMLGFGLSTPAASTSSTNTKQATQSSTPPASSGRSSSPNKAPLVLGDVFGMDFMSVPQPDKQPQVLQQRNLASSDSTGVSERLKKVVAKQTERPVEPCSSAMPSSQRSATPEPVNSSNMSQRSPNPVAIKRVATPEPKRPPEQLFDSVFDHIPPSPTKAVPQSSTIVPSFKESSLIEPVQVSIPPSPPRPSSISSVATASNIESAPAAPIEPVSVPLLSSMERKQEKENAQSKDDDLVQEPVKVHEKDHVYSVDEESIAYTTKIKVDEKEIPPNDDQAIPHSNEITQDDQALSDSKPAVDSMPLVALENNVVTDSLLSLDNSDTPRASFARAPSSLKNEVAVENDEVQRKVSTVEDPIENDEKPIVQPPIEQPEIPVLIQKTDIQQTPSPPIIPQSAKPPPSPIIPPQSPPKNPLLLRSPVLGSTTSISNKSSDQPPTSPSSETKYLKDVIAQREKQLLQSMQDHARLLENNNTLKAQVEELEVWKDQQVAALEGEREDSEIRISQLERALDTTTKERDALRQQSSMSQNSMQATLEQTTRLLHEKEEEIKGLLLEGERLSKTELKYSNLIKQQKSKISDMEKVQVEMTRKFESSTTDVSDMKEKIARLSDSEKKLQEALRAAAEVNEQQAKGLVRLEGELGISKDAYATLQSALDRAWQELAESRKMQAEQSLTVQSEALEKGLKQNEDLNRQLDLLRSEADRAEAAYKKEIFEIRATLSRAEEEAGWREDNFRKEVALLQARLQSAEARHEDLTTATDDSTRPLLRQIEALQTQHQATLRSWEAVEKNLTMRLHEAESERQIAVENERMSSDRLMELKSRIAMLETQVSQERADNSRLRVAIETERSRAETSDRLHLDVLAKLESIKTSHTREVEELKETFKKTLAQEIEEHQKIWDERQKVADKIRQTKEAERQRIVTNRRSTTPSTTSINTSSQQQDQMNTTYTSSNSGMSPVLPVPRTSTSSINEGDGWNGTSNSSAPPAAVVDRLTVTIRQYEGQMASLQNQLAMAQKLRDELAEEMVKLTNENENLKLRQNRLEEIERERDEVTQRYNQALELLGEQTERVEELNQDIKDMKELYKAQLNELVLQVNHPPS